jgi:dihydroxyacetone kinase-like predicted kinase
MENSSSQESSNKITIYKEIILKIIQENIIISEKEISGTLISIINALMSLEVSYEEINVNLILNFLL